MFQTVARRLGLDSTHAKNFSLYEIEEYNFGKMSCIVFGSGMVPDYLRVCLSSMQNHSICDIYKKCVVVF